VLEVLVLLPLEQSERIFFGNTGFPDPLNSHTHIVGDATKGKEPDLCLIDPIGGLRVVIAGLPYRADIDGTWLGSIQQDIPLME
jgi:hypothetical protein